MKGSKQMQEHDDFIKLQILSMIRALPQAKFVDEDQINDYMVAARPFDEKIIASVVQKYRFGKIERKNKSAMPALWEFIDQLNLQVEHEKRAADESCFVTAVSAPLPETHFSVKWDRMTRSERNKLVSSGLSKFGREKIPSSPGERAQFVRKMIGSEDAA